MEKIRDVIYRLRKSESLRSIQRSSGVYRPLIRKIQQLSIKNLWLDATHPMPSDADIGKSLASNTIASRSHQLDAYKEQLMLWKQAGYTAVVIQRLLQEKCPSSMQMIQRYLKKNFPNVQEPVMVRNTIPGQDLEVDFGLLMDCLDDQGVLRKAYVLSFRFRHSRKAYRQVVLNQKTPVFLKGHINAFEYFGGVPWKVILDNTKAAVLQCSRDNDHIRRSYQDLAEHYGFLISPCLPGTPQHKGGVESDMKYVKTNFLPYFKEKLKEQNVSIPRYQYLVDELNCWEEEIANQHKIHGVGRSPDDLFFSEEKQALKPLPTNRWDLNAWSEAIVQRDWRIIFDSNYYAVPYKLIGKTIQICSTETMVRIFHENQEVSCYPRAKGKWEYARKSEFAPPIEEEVLQCSKNGLLLLAEKNGPYTHQLVNTLFSHPSIDKLHSVRLLVGLAKKYTPERLENACRRALDFKMFSYIFVRDVLKNKTDLQPEEFSKSKIVPLKQPRFARDPNSYKSLNKEASPKATKDRDISTHENGMGGLWQGAMGDQVVDNEK